MTFQLSKDQQADYERDGYVILPQLFDGAETDLLRRAMEEDPAIAAHSLLRPDQEGFGTRIAFWNRAGDSVYGMAARCARMVDTATTLIGEEVYHFQSKLTAKEPQMGGAWEWHQDYGYWYYNGCLRPDMLSCMIALDKTTPENGCLQLVKGSHKLGRIDHVPLTDKQNEADPERMTHILKSHELVHAELDPGDVLVFHSNMLHRSDKNLSDNRRWTLIICYNAASNDAYVAGDDRYYVPLDRVEDAAVMAAGLSFSADDQEHFTKQAYVPQVAASRGNG
ncbi:MAG: phytanoyl-CoA dioxygenase family protein [Rhodospirillaceae bacterium]|jgi:ectoine hydroxylase-related dioxygenase (phytanoyl-CoA dioxygenase family)|nr:phytanoyl-CoA dioxygenase family protein [Rhodospirillaceae bacterium]MBT4689570.1 phytanoyl-CoA dioxygenase family protein [Rhodospirillaceae bacterium]MBT5084055.1 phytanoyl-CoA dioxygenase family protein [Rhodospirillaceae bacterium]MBT5525104.1 phytanoyl-CoA dioxygenase family protein [Rhodospirillaceae bacterium]MBT5882132.1 phytanoyl-CoA dioxygenase family protein [Rhodospirillaceae bacterium]